ncbi:MAG TPA: hypothetical protein VFT59_05900 [Candidatus Saccharimonadales bacterium]|nr:hypothetical protein [Candidatus Saccharimonadales bacterium]
MIKTTAKYLLKAVAPSKVLQSRMHKRVFMNFAEKIGLVYFGYVDQHGDEHRLVRGLTMSPHHRDNHYCIGTFQKYDVTLVERMDTIKFPRKPAKNHTWIIMEFDLHTKEDLPHIFLGLHSHSETFYAHLFTKFAHLTKVPLGTFGAYDSAFTNRYAVYTESAKALEAERIFDQETAKLIAERFGSLTIEVADNCLYLYAEHQRPTEALLERMIKYGVWLAETIDRRTISS